MTIRQAAPVGLSFFIAVTAFLLSVHTAAPAPSATVLAASSDSFHFPDEPTDRSPETYKGSFLYTTATEMLAAQGVQLYPNDKVFAFPDPALGIGSDIKVYRAQSILIKDGAATRQIRSWSKSVGAVLDEFHVSLGAQDIVQPGASTPVSLSAQPFVISITRVAETVITVPYTIPNKTQYQDDPDLLKGNQVVDVPGNQGSGEKKYKVRRENGVEVSETLISDTVKTKPVDQVIRRGTKVPVIDQGQASWYDGVPALTAAHRTLPIGTKVTVVNLGNGKKVTVTINDRGPFVAGRVIDLSADAFATIANPGSGVINVKIEKE